MVECRVRRALAMGLVVIMLAGAAHAGNQQDYDGCVQGADQKLRIAACTRIIQDQSEDAGNRAVAYDNRGIAYKLNKDFNRAIADYNEAIRLNPRTASTHYNRGLAYEAKGDKVRASADFKAALRIKPDLAQAREELTKLTAAYTASQQDFDDCNQDSNPDRRIAGCTRAMQDTKLSPQIRAVGYNLRAIALYAKGDLDRSIADFSDAIRLGLKGADPYNNRGLAYTAKGDSDRAIADYSEAIRLDPKAVPPYNNRGLAYEAKGDRARAIADFKKVLELKPDLTKAREELSKLAAPVDAGKTIS